MPSPEPIATLGGVSSQGHVPATAPPRSYLNAATKPLLNTGPRLNVPLASRPITYVDNMPLVVFSPVKIEQLNKQRENTLIMKLLAAARNFMK